jgi:hypothetical protein
MAFEEHNESKAVIAAGEIYEEEEHKEQVEKLDQ